MVMVARLRASAAVLFIVVLSFGCSSKDRVVEVGGSGGVGGAGSDAGACASTPDGEYFLALSAPLSASSPIVFLAALSSGELSLQPLHACDREKKAGPAISLGALVPNPTGYFDFDPPPFTVPAAANPVTSVSGDVQIDLTSFRGALCGPSPCGDADGDVTSPLLISVDGSTWAARKVTGPADYPEPPALDCKGTLAAPKPGACPGQ